MEKTEAMNVGVLALQGGFERHGEMLRKLNVQPRYIRKAAELEGCVGLIIPGGESTTMTLLIEKYGLHRKLIDFAACHPVMGTCAGAIMLSSQVEDPRVKPLNLMAVKADRNAYGRQTESFITQISTPFTDDEKPLKSIFIRAPQLEPLSSDVQVLAEYENKPVILQQGRMLALAFHPELTEDARIHRYFLEKLVQSK